MEARRGLPCRHEAGDTAASSLPAEAQAFGPQVLLLPEPARCSLLNARQLLSPFQGDVTKRPP